MSWKRRSWEEDLDKKIPNTGGLVKKTYYNTNIEEIQNKMHCANWFVTNAALSAWAREIEKNPSDIATLATNASFSAIATDWE